MKKLLSVPPNLVECFHDVTGLSDNEYFCTCDPIGHRLGSGGGTTWLLGQAWKAEGGADFDSWLASERRIIIHAGGQSRRLPSYAVSSKILTPIPVFRWERGQRLSQTLLDLQLPLYERIMQQAPKRLNTMIVSGDVYIRTSERIGQVPDADVVCYGLWLDASIAKNHGVFVSDRRTPNVLQKMLQKPSVATLAEMGRSHFYLTDIGIWLLSDKAVRLLMKRSTNGERRTENGEFALKEYDLYSEFGCALGTDPTAPDDEVSQLTVAIVPLPGGQFYHFGTSKEMISSTLAIQNIVGDQRDIMHHDVKPQPSIFTQNTISKYKFTDQNYNIWVENSFIGPRWTLTHDNIVTGVPENDWEISLQPGECIDVTPVGDSDYEVRRYMIDEPVDSNALAERANLRRLFDQRRKFRQANWPALAANWKHSVFYQLDLDDAAREFHDFHLPMPAPLGDDAPLMTRIHDAMFRGDDTTAFSLLREGLCNTPSTIGQAKRTEPQLSVSADQIVWSRSPVRIDLAGGWTDTPPYCLMEGGSVVNIAIELNGQPPLQAFVKPCQQPHIVLRSIDLGATEVIETFEQLAEYNKVGSPFSIPKAALALAGFLPQFSASRYPTLRAQLESFGSGIELTLLSAIPAGSGLGTSSILAATVLGALNDFCSLAWDKSVIGHQTLLLEQLLTTGGGWQDQFGGVLAGAKLLETGKGFMQTPQVRWLPDAVFTQPEYQQCHLLYYTGITRTAKKILAEIVRRMFLNNGHQLQQLRDMKANAYDMFDAIQRQDFAAMGRLVKRTWDQNQAIDSGTNPTAVQDIIAQVNDYCLGYKLPGAGGGGYLYMVAKDPVAAARIKQVLTENRPNGNARFVDMTLSKTGQQVSRS